MTSARRQITISQLARAAEVRTSTIRYYERIGLLHPDGRSGGNYRLYDQESLMRLKFVRAAQSIGFTLDDVRLLLGAGTDERPSCRDVQHLIEERLADIGRQLKTLEHVRKVLQKSLRKCRSTERADRCQILVGLGVGSAG